MNTTTTNTTKNRSIIALGILALLTLTVVGVATISPDANASPAPAALVQLQSKSFACCEDADDASSCYPADPADLTPCGAEDEPAFCTWDPEPEALFCTPLAIKCCESSHGLTWINTCWPHPSGGTCEGTVITQPLI
jgi:hypothetical protein